MAAKTKRKAPTLRNAAVPAVAPANAGKMPLTEGQNAPSLSAGFYAAGSANENTKLKRYNRWRERYNPLRGLNIARAVALLEQYQRGELADPCWTYFFIENTDADLFALVERRTSALMELDWSVKPISSRWTKSDPRAKDFDAGLADEQVAALREAYEGIDNLYEAIKHLAMSSFRGFAHCEKYRNNDGDVYHLELVDQWNVVRDLLKGPWRYNPEAMSTTYAALGSDMDINPDDFLIRESRRHIDRLGLIKFIRANLSQKDWDAFIEIYGIPSGVVIGPANIAKDREAEYLNAAQNIAEGGSGYLPNGSDYKPNDGPRGTNPFKEHLDYLSEKLILAGTGGMLTMLAQSGSGTLAGNAHADTFNSIAAAEARKISEIFQRQLDTEIIDRNFPGQPCLVYWELNPNEEIDPEKIVEQALKLRQAGYAMDVDQLSEKTGYSLTLAALPEKVTDQVAGKPTPIPNRRRNPGLFNYNPDQARDADGKFTGDGSVYLNPEHLRAAGIPHKMVSEYEAIKDIREKNPHTWPTELKEPYIAHQKALRTADPEKDWDTWAHHTYSSLKYSSEAKRLSDHRDALESYFEQRLETLGKLSNRTTLPKDQDAFLTAAERRLATANRAAMQAIGKRLEAVLQLDGPDLTNAARALAKELPQLATAAGADAATVKAWEDVLAAALLNGLTEDPLKT